MKKFLCLLTITLITAPAFSGELIIQKIEPKNKPQENINNKCHYFFNAVCGAWVFVCRGHASSF